MATNSSTAKGRPRRRSSRIQACQQAFAGSDISDLGQVGHLCQDEGTDTADSRLTQPRRRLTRNASKRTKVVQASLQASQHFDISTKGPRNRVKSRKGPRAGAPKANASISSPEAAVPPEASLFPTLAFSLHGIASNGINFYGLVQELITPDVFGMVIVTVLLNQTTGRAAIPVFYSLLERWPTPSLLAEADLEELTNMLQPIGLHNIRAKRLKDIGRTWCESPPALGVLHKSRVVLPGGSKRKKAKRNADTPVSNEDDSRVVYPPTEISHLPGVGRYALDSFRLFRPSLQCPDRAATQVELSTSKPQSEKWEAILERRTALGHKREVGSLLPGPPFSAAHDRSVVENDWQQVDPLDKELKAYRLWRQRRGEAHTLVALG
ncbi:unnamed protein product [Parajaminaea phylloscopi]